MSVSYYEVHGVAQRLAIQAQQCRALGSKFGMQKFINELAVEIAEKNMKIAELEAKLKANEAIQKMADI